MRFVPTQCLRTGMILAKGLYGKDGSLLLQQGQNLKESYISHISSQGYKGVYIFDKLSDDIEIKEVINDELRSTAVKTIKDMYIQSKYSNSLPLTDSAKEIVHELVESIIENNNIMVNMIDLKSFDDYTYYHSVNVAVLSLIIGTEYRLNMTELFKLGLGAILHDIGKVFVDKEIIEKPSLLTTEEYELVKKHTELGYEYLNNTSMLEVPATSLAAVLQHHERYDGSGYPNALRGNKITIFGRMVAIADVYDAIISDRPYRPGMSPSEAMEYLMGGSGTLFDPNLINIFTRKVAAYPLGTCVRLSNGLNAIVVENYEDCSTRPKVKLIFSYEGNPIYFDLKNDRSLMNITISGILKM